MAVAMRERRSSRGRWSRRMAEAEPLEEAIEDRQDTDGVGVEGPAFGLGDLAGAVLCDARCDPVWLAVFHWNSSR